MLTPESDRKIAAALGVFSDHVDRQGLLSRLEVTRTERVTPLMFEQRLVERAKADRRHIVLPEGGDDRVLQAAEQVLLRGMADLTVLGDPDAVKSRAAALGLELDGLQVVDPQTSEWRQDFADTYYELRRHKGVARPVAEDLMADVSYFGTMMVHKGLADGMVSGAAHTTAHTIRPAFEFIRTKPGTSIVSSVFLMLLADRVLVYGDCAVVPNPNAEQLADIAVASAGTAAQFGIEPRVALLSYSTGESGAGSDVEKVRQATAIARERRPDLLIEGPIQYDAAIDPEVARSKLPDSQVAGRATVFVFPDLNTGNNTYKAVQRSANAVAVGPVLQGLRKPVNDLSRGALVADIVNTVAITAIQAQGAAERCLGCWWSTPGSSSIKYQLFEMDGPKVLASGVVERIGEAGSKLTHRAGDAEPLVVEDRVADHSEGLRAGLRGVRDRRRADRRAGRHRPPGRPRRGPAHRPDPDRRRRHPGHRRPVPLAPLHNPRNLLGIRIAMASFPETPQVAVFDTAFHQTMPPRAYRYALPADLAAELRIRRYGFHGTSHAYVSRKAAEHLGRPADELNLITLHLGNGASVAAVAGGRCIDTSMGLTPLEGLVMGTRSGDLDPAVVFYLHREAGLSVDDIDDLLNKRSGMLGLAGANDMREVARLVGRGRPGGHRGLDVYCYRIRKYVGAYAAALGRLDALVFTAGVGENNDAVRAGVCQGLEGLGVKLDAKRNRARSGRPRTISADDSPVAVLVVPTNELGRRRPGRVGAASRSPCGVRPRPPGDRGRVTRVLADAGCNLEDTSMTILRPLRHDAGRDRPRRLGRPPRGLDRSRG